jgi:phosphoglycolate phosphatase-like HAD superfamily hydrolase
VTSIAVDLDALGDTGPLWRAWLADAARRYRVDGLDQASGDRGRAETVLDAELGNWRQLLERFAEEHAPVHLRPRADVSESLRRLQGSGARIGVFTDAPEPLARVALAHLGAARRIDGLEAGPGALQRLMELLGDDTQIVRTPAELTALA